MSEALERVIAEQQERIDRMEKILKSMDRNSEYRRKKGEIFATAVVNYQARALRTIITDPETREKWTATNQWLRQEIKDFGFCVNCNCLDYCQCDILDE
jgi:hypothetical protein